MKHYVLVHGAWGEGSEFEAVAKTLSADGSTVITPDLPGHGNNYSPIPKVTMDAYVQRVIEVINDLDEKVVLVGHSLAGVVVALVAEAIPRKIERLVFICALLPKSGDSALGLMKSDPKGELLPKLVFSKCKSFATVKPEDIRNIMLQDAKSEDIEKMLPKLSMKQATQPFMASAQLSEDKFGTVPKYYVRASLDKVVSLTLQDSMITNWKMEQVFTLESGHFPLTSMPHRLGETIKKIG